MCGSFVSSCHSPWPDSGKARGCDSRDPTRNIARGDRWIDGVRSEVKAPEALQKIKCAAFGHACVAVNHEVFAQSLRVCRVTKQGQRYSRIASNIFHLLIRRQVKVANDKLFVLNSDPNDRDLRTTRRIERRQMGERRLCDQFAYCFRYLHLLSPAESCGDDPCP